MLSFFEYKWKYIFSLLVSNFGNNKHKKEVRYYVTHLGTKDWILGAKARRLCDYATEKSEVVYSENFKKLPKGSGYFFLHYKYAARAIRYNPHILNTRFIVMFTHPNWNKHYSPQHVAYVLNKAYKVICLNNGDKELLKGLNIEESKILVYHMASNPRMFQPKVRTGNGAVGFSMAYYKRKNPDLMLNLVKQMPEYKFILIGRDWEQYSRFEEIRHLDNFFYYADVPYEDYPELYSRMDVFVSTSNLEGGPVPVLEALLSNLPVVASKTGFCPDLIKDGINGFLFDLDASSETVTELIKKAFKIESDVYPSAIEHSWEHYGKKISSLFYD